MREGRESGVAKRHLLQCSIVEVRAAAPVAHSAQLPDNRPSMALPTPLPTLTHLFAPSGRLRVVTVTADAMIDLRVVPGELNCGVSHIDSFR